MSTRPVIMQCENCDKDMHEGDRMQATTCGAARAESWGFCQDDGAWDAVVCHACAVISDTRPDRERALLRVVSDTEHALATSGTDVDMDAIIATLQGAIRRAATNEEV